MVTTKPLDKERKSAKLVARVVRIVGVVLFILATVKSFALLAYPSQTSRARPNWQRPCQQSLGGLMAVFSSVFDDLSDFLIGRSVGQIGHRDGMTSSF